MPYDPQRHHRRSIHLKRFDYAGPGWYFVTICTWNRLPILSAVDDGEMNHTDIGMIVQDEWLRTLTVRSNVSIDAFVTMPNHLHGIVVITRRFDTPEDEGAFVSERDDLAPFTSPVQTLSSIVRGFKAATTRRLKLDHPLWQRGYYEHVLSEERDIAANPFRWADDAEHPTRAAGRSTATASIDRTLA